MTDKTTTTPSERLLEWAGAAVGASGRVVDVRGLHALEGGRWALKVEHGRAATSAVLRVPIPDRINASMIATGAAALESAERHGIPAPRLIAADLRGEAAGVPATLETLVEGRTVWPEKWSVERLRVAGAALAHVHAVAMTATEQLPFRPRPIAVDHFAYFRRRGWMPTTPLLHEADEAVRSHGLPSGATVFVHGDVWPGNLIWTADDRAVLIDWKTAGVGAPGVDLCNLRYQAAIMFGPEAPSFVLHGWEQAAGTPARDVGYWDAVAALNTPTEMDERDGIPRTERRSAFLQGALANLGSDRAASTTQDPPGDVTERWIERVREICLALPKVVESEGVASPALSGIRAVGFKVSGRVVARVFVLDRAGRDRLVLWIRTDPKAREALLSSGRNFMPLRMIGPREIGVVLDASTDWTEVAELVTDSYLLMAPKRLAAQVDARLPPSGSGDV